ncbi:hypothetical protein FQY83_06680 [Luteimonas marina]|uniref:Uncharacterized protein n=1 Tax=Luteimonas marina TaxID=488485 RepID=A0A5C5U6F1_9GAMM|nr:hypothetical protein FQY83_06680 [Luteimonas marina]
MKGISACALALTIALGAVACSTLASSTNTLSDDKIRSESAGALGYEPSDLSIVSRRTEGTNTYVNLKANDNKEFTCIINGGNLLTFGMTSPPRCNKRGEPIKADLL